MSAPLPLLRPDIAKMQGKVHSQQKVSEQSATTVRYSDRPPSVTARILGLVGTICVLLILVAAWLLRWSDTPKTVVSTTPAMTLVEIAQPEAPPAPPSESQPEPKSAERKTAIPRSAAPLNLPSINLPATIPAIARTSINPPKFSDISIALPVTNAINTRSASRASVPASHPAPTPPKANDEHTQWTGRVLAALHRAKQYPRSAKRMEQEGTCWIRFIIDRQGRVRSARLQRSSGVESLDQEALELPSRAQPLPKPPKGVTGHRIELIVPIEFFLI